MKYARLTKEQFEILQPEFTRFLASQTITAAEWETLKNTKPNVAEEELDVFSDLIWEGTLTKVSYLENWSKQQVYLFYFGASQIELIAIKTTNQTIDFTKQKGIDWLEKNIGSDDVELFEATKTYSKEKNLELFHYIKQGAVISNGAFYKTLKEHL